VVRVESFAAVAVAEAGADHPLHFPAVRFRQVEPAQSCQGEARNTQESLEGRIGPGGGAVQNSDSGRGRPHARSPWGGGPAQLSRVSYAAAAGASRFVEVTSSSAWLGRPAKRSFPRRSQAREDRRSVVFASFQTPRVGQVTFNAMRRVHGTLIEIPSNHIGAWSSEVFATVHAEVRAHELRPLANTRTGWRESGWGRCSGPARWSSSGVKGLTSILGLVRAAGKTGTSSIREPFPKTITLEQLTTWILESPCLRRELSAALTLRTLSA